MFCLLTIGWLCLKFYTGQADGPRSFGAVRCQGRETSQIEQLDRAERERLDDELKRALKHLDLLIEATLDGIYDWDLPSGRLWHSPTLNAAHAGIKVATLTGRRSSEHDNALWLTRPQATQRRFCRFPYP